MAKVFDFKDIAVSAETAMGNVEGCLCFAQLVKGGFSIEEPAELAQADSVATDAELEQWGLGDVVGSDMTDVHSMLEDMRYACRMQGVSGLMEVVVFYATMFPSVAVLGMKVASEFGVAAEYKSLGLIA